MKYTKTDSVWQKILSSDNLSKIVKHDSTIYPKLYRINSMEEFQSLISGFLAEPHRIMLKIDFCRPRLLLPTFLEYFLRMTVDPESLFIVVSEQLEPMKTVFLIGRPHEKPLDRIYNHLVGKFKEYKDYLCAHIKISLKLYDMKTFMKERRKSFFTLARVVNSIESQTKCLRQSEHETYLPMDCTNTTTTDIPRKSREPSSNNTAHLQKLRKLLKLNNQTSNRDVESDSTIKISMSVYPIDDLNNFKLKQIIKDSLYIKLHSPVLEVELEQYDITLTFATFRQKLSPLLDVSNLRVGQVFLSRKSDSPSSPPSSCYIILNVNRPWSTTSKQGYPLGVKFTNVSDVIEKLEQNRILLFQETLEEFSLCGMSPSEIVTLSYRIVSEPAELLC